MILTFVTTPVFHGLLRAPGTHVKIHVHKEQCTKKYRCFISPTISFAQPLFSIGCLCPASLLGSFLRPLKCVLSHAPAWHRLITCSGDPRNERSILSLCHRCVHPAGKTARHAKPEIIDFLSYKTRSVCSRWFILESTGQDLCKNCSRQKMAACTRQNVIHWWTLVFYSEE